MITGTFGISRFSVRAASIPPSSGSVQDKNLIGLTNLISRNPPILPKLNRRRAQFLLTKIDEILACEQHKDAERDTNLWSLAISLEVRAGNTGEWIT